MSQAVLERAETRLPRGRSGLVQAVRMEWVRRAPCAPPGGSRRLRWPCTIGLAIVVLRYYPSHWSHLSRADRASFDPVNDGFTGLALAQLADGRARGAGHHQRVLGAA